MNIKILKIQDEIYSMEVFINTHNKIAIGIQYLEDSEYNNIIELTKDDAIELKKELDILIKSL